MRRTTTLVLAVALQVAAGIAHAQNVATIEITPAQKFGAAGQTIRFTAVAKDAQGRVVANPQLAWFAAPFDVAFAEPDGQVRLLRQGAAQVFAMADGKVAQATLTVGPKPAASLEIDNAPSTIVVGGTVPLAAIALTEDREPLSDARITFRSLDETIATVNGAGLLVGRAPGEARIIAETGPARREIRVRVVENPVASIQVEGPATARTGDVVRFSTRLRGRSGQAVSNMPVRWSVGGDGGAAFADGAFVAEKPGTYVVSATVGGVTGSTAINVTPRVHGRRLETVANRVFSHLQAAEHWAIGDVLYVSTVGDRAYTFDIRDPANPVLTDSIIVDARHINDISTTADGKIGVLTRENAASRRNGIVFLDLSQPLHPKVLSEYTATVTGGVHSAFIDAHYVYLTDDATGSMRVIDFRDPKNPKEVARWEVSGVAGPQGIKDPGGNVVGASIGRYLHDLQVKDGLAYLAYWRDGLVILDVGNGIKGGSPEKPQLVGRFTYNVGDYYPADRIAGTHTTFRYGNYLFVGDEVFPSMFDLTKRERIEALGIIHVLDVSNVTNPRKVAEYRMPGGAHNVWVLDDVLYIGAYEGGLRALDVSGDLRGDLAAQGREIGTIWTGHPQGYAPNLPFAWGAQPHKGHIYLTDMNSGLWVARLTPAVLP